MTATRACRLAGLTVLCLAAHAAALHAATITVRAGDDLQAALNAARAAE